VSGWTGAQYSLWRIAFATYLASQEVLLALVAIPIAFGWHARIWWAVTVVYLLAGFFWALTGGLILLALVCAQLLVPGDPYLTLDRRGATDPGANWRMPAMACILVLLSPILEVVRPSYARGGELLPAAITFAALFCSPPALVVRPRRSPERDVVFYDGHCALCQASVRFLIAEDADGSRFEFAPLDSPAFVERIPEDRRGILPDSVVIRTGGGDVLMRYAAVRYALERLGGYWRVAGVLMRVVPGGAGDRMYDWIARRRYRVFGTKDEVCPLMPPTLRSRFRF
jgi:predicted DCC family thiol-disulfide oxidoreductase YuxK